MENVEWVGLDELKAAIRRAPQTAAEEAKKFLVRGIAVYKKGILNNPWRISTSGGGAPVDTGHLRDTHITSIGSYQAFIGPSLQAAPYAKYVHEGTRKMKGRPWLEYVKQDKDSEIEQLYKQMLTNIVKDLAA